MIHIRPRRYLVVLILSLAFSLGAPLPWPIITGMAPRAAGALALPGPNAGLKGTIDFIMQTLSGTGDSLALNEIIDDIVEGVTAASSSTCPVVSLDPPLDSLVNLPQSITLIADYNGPDGAGCANVAGTRRRGRLTIQVTEISLTGLALGAKMSLQADHLVQINAPGKPEQPLLNGLASGNLAVTLGFSGKANATLNVVSTSLVVGTTPITGGITTVVSGLDINGAPSDVTMKITFNDLMQGPSLTTGGVTIVMPALSLGGESTGTLTMHVRFEPLVVDGSTFSGGFTATLSSQVSAETTADTVTLDVTFNEGGWVVDGSTFLGGIGAEVTALNNNGLPGDMMTIQLTLKPLTVVTAAGTTTYEGGGTAVHTVVDAMTTQTAVDLHITNFGPIVLTVQTVEDALGQTRITTPGGGRIGAYQVQIVDPIRVDPAVCEHLPIGGKIHFTVGGQVSMAEFTPACDGSYLFNGQLSNAPMTL